ncbi:recombinase RecT [Sphingopyxis indica]|uniref:Recombination protein RecT n=1 Tax=Sphingopyxis indica TaxID=436663 RepID=A0A239KPE2_9SPHN|nr:recombinase RecT [Sphingopyxis indica]SNT20247.1 recombination protein RecT [Sphingopyxis indica]
MATQLATRDASNVAARRPDPATPQGLAFELDKGAEQMRRALPAHISPEKFQRTIITAAQANPDLLRADRQSLLLACMKAAQDGLLPDGREAALVIFNNREKDGQGKWVTVKRATYMPMVYGLRKKILQSGEIRDITAKVVYRAEYERGTFLYEEGTERMLRHKPDLLLSDEDMTDDNIVAAYSIATFKDGSMSYEVMSRAEINKVRQASKTGAVGMTNYKGEPIPPKGPWVDWFGEMAKKTVMRRHAKTLPMSGDIIDIEGREADDAELARSARHVLDVETEAPVALPQADELAGEDDTPAHDPETGELAEGGADTATPDNPAAAEGPADEQRGDAHDGTDDDADAPYAATVAELLDRAGRAETLIDAKAVEKDWQGHMAALPDRENALIEAAVKNAMARFGK